MRLLAMLSRRSLSAVTAMDIELVRILSRWPWHAGAGLVKQQETDEEDYQEIDGTLIGPGGFAVSDDGAVISASKLTVPQLKAELTSLRNQVRRLLRNRSQGGGCSGARCAL